MFFKDGKRFLKDGGGAFKNPLVSDKIRRIYRDEIVPTLHFVADTFTSEFGLDFQYLQSNLMGSTGKQPDSGDIDVALDEDCYDSNTLRSLAEKVRKVLGNDYVVSKGIPGGQLNLAIPIKGNPENGYIQVDFILGNLDWLKFSHHSPGLDVSPYKGVYISTALGVLAKMNKSWELHVGEERVARVGWAFDLERGLFIRTQVQLRPGQGMSNVDADRFETVVWTKFDTKPPRVFRSGYIKDPEAVVQILLGEEVTLSDIDTFEKLVEVVRNVYPERFDEFLDRCKEALTRSSAVKEREKIEKLELFR